jgi:hypothetical protein
VTEVGVDDIIARAVEQVEPPWEPPEERKVTAGPGGHLIAAAREWGIEPVDWSTFWTDESPDPEWCIENLIPAKRATALYSPPKLGKSLVALDAVAAAVTNRSVLGQGTAKPIRALYLDLEMTLADLRERLEDLGYGPDDDLGGLAYYQLPTLPPLDTDAGGEVLTGLALDHGADLVVVDTMARAVRGPENDNDTYRNFYRSTGVRLKGNEIALWRLDHAGKAVEQGQRGASAKADDVDLIWRMSMTDASHFTLSRTHTRIPWVPAELSMVRHDDPVLRHVLGAAGTPAGTLELALLLDELGVPLDATGATAAKALRSANSPRRKALILAALKYRRTRP